MPGPQAVAIELTPESRAELVTLTKRYTSEQQIVKRARMILAAADGQDNATISRRMRVVKWRTGVHRACAAIVHQ